MFAPNDLTILFKLLSLKDTHINYHPPKMSDLSLI